MSRSSKTNHSDPIPHVAVDSAPRTDQITPAYPPLVPGQFWIGAVVGLGITAAMIGLVVLVIWALR